MKIESLKDLQKVIQACRKLGVQSIKIDNVEFHLGDLPHKSNLRKFTNISGLIEPIVSPYTPGGIDENTKIIAENSAIKTDALTDEQLLYYSARPEAFEGQQ